MLVQQREPLHQDRAALLGGLGAPRRPCLLGRRDGTRRIHRAQVGDLRQLGAGGGVVNREARTAADPFAVDQAVGFEQRRVFQCGKRRGRAGHGEAPCEGAPS
jgi:hypothetical protein